MLLCLEWWRRVYLRASWLDRSHEFDHPPPHRHLHQPTISMGFRKSFSRGFKNITRQFVRGQKRSRSEGRKTDVGATEPGLGTTHRNSEVEVAAGSGPSQEGNGPAWDKVDPPTSSIPDGEETASTWTTLFPLSP